MEAGRFLCVIPDPEHKLLEISETMLALSLESRNPSYCPGEDRSGHAAAVFE